MPVVAVAGERRVVVFAAASTTEAVTALAERFNARNDVDVVPSFAASSTLARQIESGAPADIYISADRRWMKYLTERGLIDPASRCDLWRNRLVLVAPADSALALDIVPGFPLVAALGGGRLAIGDPDHVPSGIYARQALDALGVWPAVADRVVRTADVRAALALVARGEAAAGIIYATDARVSERVRIVGAFPQTSHEPIVYPAGRVAGSDNPAAAGFLAYLHSNDARATVGRYGFSAFQGSACSP